MSGEEYVEAINLADTGEPISKYWRQVRFAPPKIPEYAVEKNISGCTNFSFVINSKGRAKNIKTIRSNPGHIFTYNFRNALKKYKWKPTEFNSERRPVKAELVLSLSIANDESLSCEEET